ncbi:hypothetical protein TIFTF001_000141 [Ficus carica]|uniref:Cation/H(+) antiporter central domain-containing protein n=1 Tax=Ficus carica TaxID=3494 RepID=A0AA87ZF25_FICCA|nr:hypothetical protein TIFTF001_000141 [Ficus carica]
MLFMFLVGVKIDLNSVKHSGKKGLTIGLCCFFLPLLLNTSVAVLLQRTVKMDPILHKSIISIVVFQSSSSFYVTTCLLTDLKLLNSELGRLAVSASMISGMLSWCGLIWAFTMRQSSFGGNKALPFVALSLCFVVILVVFLMRPIMRSIHFMLGPTILGLAVPDGPPLGSALVDKLESYVLSILLPGYFVFSGAAMDLIDQQSYSIMVISTVVLTGTITLIVKKLYNPSKRYASSKGRTMEYASAHDTELRLLACIHRQENTPSLIRLLEVSNPTTKSPVCCYVVHLIPLAGRSTPLLITHRPGCRSSFHSNLSDHIINALQLFEQNNHGKAIMTAITAMAPCTSMHDDICSLVLEKRACMVIIPFHTSTLTADNSEALTTNNPLRTVNLNILRKAPCSVGILVDRSDGDAAVKTLSSKDTYSVGMIFIEGPDDREELAYAMRMGEKPNVSISVIRLRQEEAFLQGEGGEEQLGDDKRDSVDGYHSYNMILVGRRHWSESPLFAGLTEWTEYPELGSIGNVLASGYTNNQVSLLVVQQHAFEEVKVTDGPKYHVMVAMDSPVSVRDASPGHHHDLSGSTVRPPVSSVSMETNRKSRGLGV